MILLPADTPRDTPPRPRAACVGALFDARARYDTQAPPLCHVRVLFRLPSRHVAIHVARDARCLRLLRLRGAFCCHTFAALPLLPPL